VTPVQILTVCQVARHAPDAVDRVRSSAATPTYGCPTQASAS